MTANLNLPSVHPAYVEPVSIGVLASDHWLTSIYRVTVPLGLKLDEFDIADDIHADILILEVTLDTLEDVISWVAHRLDQPTFVVGARDCQPLHMLLLEAGASGCFFSTRQLSQLGRLLSQFTER